MHCRTTIYCSNIKRDNVSFLSTQSFSFDLLVGTACCAHGVYYFFHKIALLATGLAYGLRKIPVCRQQKFGFLFDPTKQKISKRRVKLYYDDKQILTIKDMMGRHAIYSNSLHEKGKFYSNNKI